LLEQESGRRGQYAEEALGSLMFRAHQHVMPPPANVLGVGLRCTALDEPSHARAVIVAGPSGLDGRGAVSGGLHTSGTVCQHQALEPLRMAHDRTKHNANASRESAQHASLDVQGIHDAEHILNERLGIDLLHWPHGLAGTPTIVDGSAPCLTQDRKRG
jgi:hypothetical protein